MAAELSQLRPNFAAPKSGRDGLFLTAPWSNLASSRPDMTAHCQIWLAWPDMAGIASANAAANAYGEGGWPISRFGQNGTLNRPSQPPIISIYMKLDCPNVGQTDFQRRARM